MVKLSEEDFKLTKSICMNGLSEKLLDYLKKRSDSFIRQLKVANKQTFKQVQGRLSELDDLVEFINSGRK